MKPKSSNLFAIRSTRLAAAAMLCLGATAHAANYTWTNGATNLAWDASSANWDAGSGNTAWVNSNDAIFGATGIGAITVSGTQTVTSLTTNANGYSLTGGQINLGSASTAFVISNDIAIGSIIGGGSNALVKSGSGNLTLSAANTYTGGTTISGGTLQIGNGGSTGSLASGAIVNNANLVYNLDTNGTASLPSGANITGSGNLSATAGVVQFNGNITQGGALAFTQVGGSGYYKGLEVATSTTLTGSSITLAGDAGKKEAGSHTLALDTSAANGTISLNISLGRGFTWYNLPSFSANAGTGAIDITGGGPSNSGWGGTPVTLTGAVNMTGNVSSGAAVTIDSNTTTTGNISAAFSGGMPLTKSGTGTLKLTGANTYTGGTTISGGTLQIGNGGSTGSLGSGAIVNNANLVYNLDTTRTVSLPSGANISGSGNLTATAGVIQFNGNITQGGALSFTQVGASALFKGLEVVAASTTLTGASISLTGDVGKSYSAGNTLALDTSAANGTIDLNISLGRGGVWYDLSSFSANAGTGAVNITGGGGAGWGGTPVALTGAVNMTGNVNSGAAVTIDSNTTTTGNISAAFSGGMPLTKSGTGTLSLTGANTYTGTTTISAGALQIGNGGTTGSLYSASVTTGYYGDKNLTFGSTGAIVNNGELVYNIAGGDVNVNKTISGTGTLNVTGNQSVNFANGTSISTGGSQTYSATATSGRSYGFNLTDNATVTLASTAGDISMTGYLGTSNSHTGNLNINTNAGNGNVTLNTPTSIAFVDYGLNSLAVDAGTGSITLGTYNAKDWGRVNTISLTGGAINSTAKLTDFTTLTVTNSAASAFGGNLTASGGSLVKAGTGTLTLTGTNSYGGGTSVDGGTLEVTGSIGSSAVTVNNAGTVLSSGATGTIGKGVTVNSGAILAAGGKNTVGTATVGSDGLNFASGSIFDWDLTTGAGDGTYDTVSVTGALAITSGAKFNVVSSTVFSDPFWNTTHTWSNIFGGKAIDNFLVSNFQYNGSATAPSAEGSFSISGASLTWTAVPEPTSALAGLLITAGLLRRRRK